MGVVEASGDDLLTLDDNRKRFLETLQSNNRCLPTGSSFVLSLSFSLVFGFFLYNKPTLYILFPKSPRIEVYGWGGKKKKKEITLGLGTNWTSPTGQSAIGSH
jgi:hypothetical protein